MTFFSLINGKGHPMTCLCWQRGGGGTAPTNSQPITTRRCVIINMFRPLYPLLPILQAVGWIPEQSERHGKSRPHRYSIPEPSSPQQVTIHTTLFRPPFRWIITVIYQKSSRRNLETFKQGVMLVHTTGSNGHKSALTLRQLMFYIYIYIYIYIYGAPILDVSRSHTTTQHSR